ncbi:membrane cofactor protein isoform X2 [Bombina bombina]|uniref:membrane cofactor protein isoform X2 n=1 Tax=Bombina bombina TaxID=8345 RepID=UPI00235AD201|nr:membrane cofactor protein isoform X2 [Bombina bombina]
MQTSLLIWMFIGTFPGLQTKEQCTWPHAEGTNILYYFNKELYNRGDKVEIHCIPGYQPSQQQMTCVTHDDTSSKWDVSIPCFEQCQSPDAEGINRSYFSNNKYYNRGDEVIIQCITGYHPAKQQMACVANGDISSNWNESYPCVEQCQSPDAEGINRSYFSNNKYYNRGDEVIIQCITGYHPAKQQMACVANGDISSNWNESYPCVEQCQSPDAEGINKSYFSNNKYYNRGDEVIIQCITGYHPAKQQMACVANGDISSNWNESYPCVDKEDKKYNYFYIVVVRLILGILVLIIMFCILGIEIMTWKPGESNTNPLEKEPNHLDNEETENL